MRLRLRVEYDGSQFHGWQLQPQGPTVQGALEAAFLHLCGGAVRVIGAGRTDAGVHARGQVAHCDVSGGPPAGALRAALNAVLPPAVAVLELAQVAPGFDARRDALRKRYRYRILARRPPSPLRQRETWHVRAPLDARAMREAARSAVGHHDFAAFRGAPGGAPAGESTLRTLDRLSVEEAGDELQIVAEGRSFLRYMVRNLVGALVEIGRGRLRPADLARLLAARERRLAPPPAPPGGLCLEQIWYPGDPSGDAPPGAPAGPGGGGAALRRGCA